MQDASTSVFDLQHDFAILDRYQGFSGELIRLALAGMAAVGLFVAWFVGTDHRPYDRAVSGELPVLSLFIALVSFGVSAAFALGHRYWSTDSMSAYVAMLRSLAKSAGAVDVPGGSPADARARVGAEGKAEAVRAARDLALRRSALALGMSSLALLVGAVVLGAALIVSIA